MKVRTYRRIEQMYKDGVSSEVCVNALMNLLSKEEYADVSKWVARFVDFVVIVEMDKVRNNYNGYVYE